MKKRNKLLPPVLAIAVVLSMVGIISTSAESVPEVAVYSKGSMDITQSGIIKGDGIIASGKLTGSYNAWATGHIYAASNVKVDSLSVPNQSVVKDYTGITKNYSFADYNRFPETTYFLDKDTAFKDGTQDLTVGWDSNAGEKTSGYAITADSYIRNLTVRDTLTLNIDVPEGQIRIIRVDSLKYMRGSLVIRGGGKVILYVDRIENCANGLFNATGSGFGKTESLTMLVDKRDNGVNFDSARIAGNLIFLDNKKFSMPNTALQGNLYANGDVTLNGSASIRGLVYAPISKTTVTASAYIVGRLITDELVLSGSSYIQNGTVSGLPSGVGSRIGDKNDAQIIGTVDEPTTTQTAQTSQTNQTSQTTQPTGTDPDDNGSGAGTVQITVTVARRMSIRLENGQILKNGDKFTMPKYGTVRFQVCTNNWDTNTYTDDGQGIAGQKVFEYTHQRNKENFLRVDNVRYFVPVRFHFVKGDYQKLTGVDNVLSTPLESLSINFPIGATITVKAYVKNQIVDTQNLFIDSNLAWHNWNY